MATHFRKTKELFHRAPVTLLLGPPNTCKTLLSKVTASLMGGLHRTALYNELIMARMNQLIGESLFFVYNDPDQPFVLKTMVTKVIILLK